MGGGESLSGVGVELDVRGVHDVHDVELMQRSGPGSCYQCSTLTDTTGLCQVMMMMR